MKNIFGEDGLAYRVITRMVDLIILNVIFLVSCIPLITIGAACTALYSLTLKMCKNEESYIVRSYFKYFRENFKKATGVWVISAVFLAVIGVDFQILGGLNSQTGNLMRTMVLAVFLLGAMILSYVFPLLAKFENSIGNTFKNAGIIAMTRIIYTIPVACINLVPLMLLLYGGQPMLYGIRIYLVTGFSLAAYINSFALARVFQKYIAQ